MSFQCFTTKLLWQEEKSCLGYVDAASFSDSTAFTRFIPSYSNACNIEITIKLVLTVQMQNDINMQKIRCFISACLYR